MDKSPQLLLPPPGGDNYNNAVFPFSDTQVEFHRITFIKEPYRLFSVLSVVQVNPLCVRKFPMLLQVKAGCCAARGMSCSNLSVGTAEQSSPASYESIPDCSDKFNDIIH